MDLKEEDILGEAIDRHWYYVAKGRALRQFLGKMQVPEVLDVGAGSGVFSKQLLDHGIADSAVCIDPHYQKEKNTLHNEKSLRYCRAVEEVPQKLILMMDVLEHVEDDVGLLKQYAGPMPEDGRVLISVPAFQFLWSGHDLFLGHYRRYDMKMLLQTVQAAGLQPVKIQHFFGTLFPAVAIMRLLKRKLEPKSELKQYPAWLNAALIAIHDAERYTLFRALYT